MMQIEGQMDLFQFLNPAKDPPVLLRAGQIIYEVKKGDIEKYTVTDEPSWRLSNTNRGYRLIKESGSYSCAFNETLNIVHFMDFDEAESKARDYFVEHPDVIFRKDIYPKEVLAYTYVREVDSRKMLAFICDLGDKMYYVKEFMTYEHICCGKKHFNKFMKQYEMEEDTLTEIKNYQPKFKNMYKTRGETDWAYAEAGYSMAVG